MSFALDTAGPQTMTVQTWKGKWWLPGSPDDAYAGTLVHESYGDLRLELIGGFGIETRVPREDGRASIGIDGGRWPMIHGTAGGTEFTLLGNFATYTGGGFGTGSVREQTISALRGLEGMHLASVDDPVFAEMEIEIEYLLGWVARTSISASMRFEGRWSGQQTLRTAPVDEQTAEFEERTFTLRVPHEQFRIKTEYAGNRRSVINREFAVIDVEAMSPISLRALDDIAKALQDLATLVADEPAGVLRRTLRLAGAGPSVRLVNVLGRQVFKPGSRRNSDRPTHDYLFTLDTVDFARLLPAWLALYRKARLPLSMLFGTKYAPAPYTPVNLLTVAAAAEGLHRCLHDRAPLEEEKFNATKKAVLAMIPKTDKVVRKLLREQFQNDLTYRERLSELAKLPDQETSRNCLGTPINGSPD